MSEFIDVEAYLSIEPVWSRWNKTADGHPYPEGGRITGVTKKAPAGRQAPGTLVTKIKLRIPIGAFLPLRPEAVITIPEGLLVGKAIEAEALDAHEEHEPEAEQEKL